MARYKNGINGPLSGKIGNVVAASYRGVDYLRSSPRASKKPVSVAQLERRKMFALVMSWLKPVLQLIGIGYQGATTGKTPMNAAISYHMREAVMKMGPDFGIDFTKVIFSRGELMISFIVEFSSLVDAVLHIKWGDAPVTAFSRETDQATFVFYNAAKEAFVSFQDAALRGQKEVVLPLPRHFKGDAVHAYMFYVSAEGNQVSTSLYLGLVLLA